MKRGTCFTHRHTLTPDWSPGPGQRYADGTGRFRMDRASWDRDYGSLDTP